MASNDWGTGDVSGCFFGTVLQYKVIIGEAIKAGGYSILRNYVMKG